MTIFFINRKQVLFVQRLNYETLRLLILINNLTSLVVESFNVIDNINLKQVTTIFFIEVCLIILPAVCQLQKVTRKQNTSPCSYSWL